MSHLIRIAGTVQDSIVDGPGFRFTVFTQGCPHNCPGCHNPQTHDFSGGEIVEVAKVIELMVSNPLTDGLTLSGGEPFCQSIACAEIARAARASNLNVWVYSGWTFEQLIANDGSLELLQLCDVLVDGPFILSQRSLSLPWRGSTNQRLIDVPASLKTGKAVEIRKG